MKEMTIAEIANAVNGVILQGCPEMKVKDVSIDSRKIKVGALFFAIIGERFDGHEFIDNAVKEGASSVVVDRKVRINSNIGVIQVADTTKALQDLATYYRLKLSSLQVIAVTGSVGKTTTKDMISVLLKEKFKVSKTEGNLNNYYGLPLTLLSLKGNEDYAVLEMGMSQLGEIELLSKIAKPKIGVITNVGPTHLESLGTIDNVAKGKSELICSLPEYGTAILNFDDRYVKEMKDCFKGSNLIYYGFSKNADIYADRINYAKEDGCADFELVSKKERIKLKLNKPGKHNLYNALAAISVVRECGLSWQQIRTGLLKIELSALRWDIKKLSNSSMIINDTYNANPLSMKAAIETTKKIAKGRTIAVLGDMLELGSKEETAHYNLGRFIYKMGIDILFTVGSRAKMIAQGALDEGISNDNIFVFSNNEEAGKRLLNCIETGDTVLVKGSRGIHMEEIVDLVLKQED